jgi:hypothetical protein
MPDSPQQRRTLMIQLALIAAIITVIAIVAVSRLATASLSGAARCWHSNAYFSLFSSLFFFDPPNRFVQIPRDLS